jgi:hypothetical protein
MAGIITDLGDLPAPRITESAPEPISVSAITVGCQKSIMAMTTRSVR